MKHIKNVKVSLDFGEKIYEVGELVESNQQVYFQYYDGFLETNFEISPFHLKKTENVLLAPKKPFNNLHGVFSDSLSDGWGRLLMDKKLMQLGKIPTELSELERLCYLGKSTQGALFYEPLISSKTNNKKEVVDLDFNSSETKKILKGESTEILEELYTLGGASVGARPKILVAYHEKNNQIVVDDLAVKKDFEHWIIKFSSLGDFEDIAKIEYTYYLMAKKFGIKMSDCRLFNTEKGNCFFGTKRFDRLKNNRLHLHSAAGLLHDNFRLSNMDYGHIMDASIKLKNDLKACEEVFKLAVFNVFTMNMDDHSKNFAFLMDDKGAWDFAPAYDLTFSPNKYGNHSISIAGNNTKPTSADLLKLSEHFGINNGKEIISELKEIILSWKDLAKEFEINKTEKMIVQKALFEKMKD